MKKLNFYGSSTMKTSSAFHPNLVAIGRLSLDSLQIPAHTVPWPVYTYSYFQECFFPATTPLFCPHCFSKPAQCILT